jgi:hypothetical protein
MDGRLILNWIFKKLDVRGLRLDRSGSGQEEVAGVCECGNELSGFINASISGLAEDLLASLYELCSMELVS